MDRTHSLAAYFRKLATDIRQDVNQQDTKILARQVDLVRPVQAGRLLCNGLDHGHFDDSSACDLRRYAMAATEDGYRWLLRLQAGSEEAESFWPAGAAMTETDPGLENRHLDSVLKASRLIPETLTDEEENLSRDLGFLCSWWQFILELWNSDPLRFPPDTERHFLFLRCFLMMVNHPTIPDVGHRYPPLDEKSSRSRHRLRGAAELQATACENVADRIENEALHIDNRNGSEEPAAPIGHVKTEPNDPESPNELLCGAQEMPVRGIPDENGFVDFPVDPTAYVPQAEILATHTPPEFLFTDKKFAAIVEDGSNGVRWTRPRNSDGELRINRRLVHLGDWHRYISKRTATEVDGTPHVAPDECENRTASIRAGKANSESSDSISRLLSHLTADSEN